MIRSFIEKKAEIARRTNPDQILVEDVRQFLGLPSRLARAMLDLGVREGWLQKYVGLINPATSRMVAAVPFGETPPSTITDPVAADMGEESELEVTDMDRLVFYKYTGGASA